MTNCWIGHIYYDLENILLIYLLWLLWFYSCTRVVFCWSALPQLCLFPWVHPMSLSSVEVEVVHARVTTLQYKTMMFCLSLVRNMQPIKHCVRCNFPRRNKTLKRWILYKWSKEWAARLGMVCRQNVAWVYIINMHQVAGECQEKERLFVNYVFYFFTTKESFLEKEHRKPQWSRKVWTHLLWVALGCCDLIGCVRAGVRAKWFNIVNLHRLKFENSTRHLSKAASLSIGAVAKWF